MNEGLLKLSRILVKARPGQLVLKVGISLLKPSGVGLLLDPTAILSHEVVDIWGHALMKSHPESNVWIASTAYHEYIMNRTLRESIDQWGEVSGTSPCRGFD